METRRREVSGKLPYCTNFTTNDNYYRYSEDLKRKSNAKKKSNREGVAVKTKAIKQMTDANCAEFAIYLESDWLKRCMRHGIICQYDRVSNAYAASEETYPMRMSL